MVMMGDESGARVTFQALMEISNLLNTGLDKRTLVHCVRLCEKGVNPEVIANMVKEIKRETKRIKQDQENGAEY